MVRSINEIGHIMGKQTIAEYVESQEIFGKLGELGVDFAQGYGSARPMILRDPPPAPAGVQIPACRA
jgi:EAL domain-containing protein (putative c-di-GMP-specific phosphodiesterase class I)